MGIQVLSWILVLGLFLELWVLAGVGKCQMAIAGSVMTSLMDRVTLTEAIW